MKHRTILTRFRWSYKPLVLILHRMSGSILTIESWDEDKDKKNKLVSFCINEEKLKFEILRLKI